MCDLPTCVYVCVYEFTFSGGYGGANKPYRTSVLPVGAVAWCLVGGVLSKGSSALCGAQPFNVLFTLWHLWTHGREVMM